MAKRAYKCEGPFKRESDAKIEATLIRKHFGHKATVKKRVGGFYVCRTVKRKRS